MIRRTAINYLEQWKIRDDRRPLILRGARQVGKTTLINEFAKQYDVFLSLNLEKVADKALFETFSNVQDLTDAIYRHCRQQKKESPSLLFIDEIQNSPQAVAMLRYFYEEMGHLHVICAGSLLESLIDNHISFPVGRAEYLAIRPCSFIEFLDGINEAYDLNLVEQLEVTAVHDRVMQHFMNYILVGGMPAVIVKYAINRDIVATDNIFEILLNAYIDDVQKYARNETISRVIQYILKVGWKYAGEAISFERFGESNYKSREVGEAFRTIEKAMLLELVYPITNPQIPLLTTMSRKPKLLWLDTGLVNYYAGVRDTIFSVSDIMEAWRGKIAEHIVGQELLAGKIHVSAHRQFWVRNKPQSMAEVDFVVQYKNMALPIEVKSGHNSKLKSLHQYMDLVPHDIAVRVWTQPFSVNTVETPNGKKFKLFNIPFYYVGVLDKVLEKSNV
ncbi:ATP-binding protein [Parabacteroides sp. Marseille-P3160]|uniref:ATP-binding protein n=1 Tax=Parabacteroides sp. Marseille-P3160 TaxID=1917887 RepID=UPI0009B980DF|nr:AAA family ATPase [Parabacteroides sp. Marseille-P3160]